MKINIKLISVALIVVFGLFIGYKNQTANAENAVIKNIHSRTSVRSYTDKIISDDTLTNLVKAAMAAPTAGNTQPWEFIIVNDKETLKKLGNIHNFSSPAEKANAVIVVMANMDTYKDRPNFEKFWIADTSAATQNILLAANSMGIGSVWLSVYPSEERETKVKDVLNVKNNIKVLCMIALGYPEGNNLPKDKWKSEKVFYNSYK